MKVTERVKAGWSAFRQGAAGGPLFPVGAAISAAMQARAIGDFQAKAAPFIWPDWRSGVPQWKMFSYEGYVEEGFNLNTLIYSAIMYKCRSGRASPLKAWTGTPEEREPADLNHALSKLVARPNPHQSWAEFQDQYTVYINISGNNYGLLDRPSPGALPTAMYNLRPDRVFVVPGMVDGRHTVMGYLYVPEGKSAFFRLSREERLQAQADGRATLILPSDMMHVKFPNPGDPLEGMGDGLSPISPLARSADVDNAVTHFLKLFFEHGITVPGLLSFDNPLDDPTAARIKERWKEIYGGYERWAEEIMLAGSGAKYQRIGFTFDEMGFSEIDERNESRIHGPFGVPPILTGSRVGLTRSSYGMAYEQARQAFWEDTMVPETMLFEAEYQWVLRSDDGVFVAYDLSRVPALRQNIPALVVAIKDLFSIGMPANQAIRTVGLKAEPIPGGDTAYLPLNLIPVGTTPSTEDDLSDAPDADDDTRKMLALLQGKKKQQTKGFSHQAKQHLYKQVDFIAASWDRRFANRAKRAFEKDRRALLARLQKAKTTALEQKQTADWQAVNRDWDDYWANQAPENWREEFLPVIEGIIVDQGNAWNTAFGMQFDVRNLFAEEWFDIYTLEFAQDINKTTKDNLSEMLQQAQREGWSIDQMRKQIDLQFDQYIDGNQVDCSKADLTQTEQWFCDRQPRFRREAIARTETIRASSAGSNALFEAWQVVEGKEWLATGDDRTRNSHLVAWADYSEGGTPGPIPLSAMFQVGSSSLMYPGDPRGSAEETVNCRCTILPWFSEAAGTPQQIQEQQAAIAAEQERRREEAEP